jgi:hypothetical protein
MIRRVIKIVAAVVLLAIVAVCIDLAMPRHDYFIERAGSLRSSEPTTAIVDGVLGDTVHLESTTGLEVDMRVIRPDSADGGKLPVLLLLGGYTTGKDAVDLVGAPVGMAFAAIDYPYHGELALSSFWESASAIPAVRQAFLDSPPALSLAVSWLLQQPWVDTERVELAGVSLGVPFAAVAGALDKRISRVWLLHGGGDNVLWISHLARRKIHNRTVRNALVRTTLFFVNGSSFQTQRWIREIAPRPLIIVAADADDIVPADAQESLIEAAQSNFVELIWTEGRHVSPVHLEELKQVVAIIHDRIVYSTP